VTDAQKSSSSLSALLASVGIKEPPAVAPAHHHHSHDPSAQYQLLLDQVSHWRRVAMKRLTQSLVPLPDLGLLSKSVIASEHALPTMYPAGTTVRQPNVFAVRNIELVGYDADSSTSADYTALYRKIRLLRAASVRIRPIGGAQTLPAAEGSAQSRSEALRNRIKAKTNVIYRVSSVQ
jgi:hypothetical protein